MTNNPPNYQNKPDILSLSRLPARLNVEQTAKLLGFQPHDIPVLIRLKLLNPLGNPSQSAPKYFAASIVLNLVQDDKWLSKATSLISKNWKRKNQRGILKNDKDPANP
jgi:hypothetical protein